MQRTAPTTDALCVAPKCFADANPLAPAPLCARHLRKVYEFCTSLVDDRWTDAVEQTRQEPEPDEQATPSRAVGATLSRPGWVYFIQKDGLVKIGFSTKPTKRFAVLRPDAVLGMTPGTMMTERDMHALFAHLREHGEWFRPAPELLAFIGTLKAA